ncbi:hypothetical protein PBY51_004506 [Eleginops maclovinus]|uniref:Uncharacterized protein n=1 Tax=Eleginops maclovinus TaxID=56733 RepID=A0AAN7Y448_ELEMC|nr:hypothetical protein PBY51_004506 [Eleginops maclovinus]
MEEVFDIMDTAVLVLEELVMWSAPTVPLNVTRTPPANSTGGSGTVRCGGTECQFSPPVNTSQHALIPPTPIT